MRDEHIEIDQQRADVERQRISISISDSGIDVYFYPALPDGPRKVTRAELMAAGALMGIAGVLTGKGADDVLRAMVKMERETKGKVGRR